MASSLALPSFCPMATRLTNALYPLLTLGSVCWVPGAQGLRVFLRVWVATSIYESTNRHQATPPLSPSTTILPTPSPPLRCGCPGGISTRVGELVRPLRTNSFREVWLLRPLKGDNMGFMPLKGPKSHAILSTCHAHESCCPCLLHPHMDFSVSRAKEGQGGERESV